MKAGNRSTRGRNRARPVAVYFVAQGVAIAGGLLWNTVVRPVEERDLEARFGSDFRAYRAAVRCWLPRRRPYRPPSPPSPPGG